MTDVDFARTIATQRRSRLMAASALAALAVTGCATTGRPIVDRSLLECKDQPASPAGAMQSDAGLFIIDLADAGADCRTKLGAVRNILEPAP